MIELTWVNCFDGTCKLMYRTRLTYKQGPKMGELSTEWSEWLDIPVVDSELDMDQEGLMPRAARGYLRVEA